MKDKQNQFYTSISKYYSEIFPYQPMQLQFVKNRVGELSGKQILDIGCATGELAFQLINVGAKVIGIDLNEDLLNQAVGRSGFTARWSGGQSADSKMSELEFVPPVFQVGNMLELETDFQSAQFDAVLCFGNTLVHLQTPELIQKMLKGVYSVLKPGGKFLMQILNYDYILSEQVTELPPIETENIRFIRKYRFEEGNPLVFFQTELVLKKENYSISNETPLLALQSVDLTELLQSVGFTEIELFSSFKQDAFGGKHLPLVLSAIRDFDFPRSKII